jgi:hypothetical protein
MYMDTNKAMNAIRAEVEAHMELADEGYESSRLPDAVWERLVDYGAVEQVLRGKKPAGWLVDAAWDLLEPTRGRPRRKHPTLDERQAPTNITEAISQLLARQAARDPAVLDFRERVLGNKLLTREAVGPWIQSIAKTEGSTVWLSVPLDDGTAIEFTKDFQVSISPPIRQARAALSHKILKYQVAGDEWTSAVTVRAGSRLDTLRHLSEALSKRFQWQKDQATVFVLTGLIPLVPRITMTVGAAGGRIRLDISPHATPREVADTYRRIRGKMLGNGKRIKPITHEKALLATFRLTKADDETWSDFQRRWNRAHPEYKYSPTRTKAFQRDAERAMQWLGRAASPFPSHASFRAMKELGEPSSGDSANAGPTNAAPRKRKHAG